MELAAAQAQVQRGLDHNPNQLELLSLQATARFLAGDNAGFSSIEQRVLALNPQFAQFYTIVAEYADWEHRYQDIVELLRKAVQVDGAEPAAHAGLGINLIRIGDDVAGRGELQRAFDLDPFDIRVFNTLNLFEKIVDKDYVTEEKGPFRFRYPRAEQAILSRYVPELMTQAWQHMVATYGLTPDTPQGVELYAEREHFAVRTSGLPNTGISGVCFGRTLAVITPHGEPLNLGMTLWHELAHVFHIALSKSRVPRWFTEGLAEYETLVRRAEWSREHDLDLYRAWREKRLPKVAQMNRAFSHAESMQDMAVAYYASTQLVTMLAERFGRDKLRRMLQLWGAGKDDEAVLREGLGVGSDRLDEVFDEYLTQRLQRYREQFVALGGGGSSSKWRARLRGAPEDVSLQAGLAKSLIDEGQLEPAAQVLSTLLNRKPHDPQALFLKGKIEAERDPKACARVMQGLLDDDQRGYDSYSTLARCQHAAGEDPSSALREAHRLDPTQSLPLFGLWQMAQLASDEAQELAILRELAKLEQHEGRVYRRLLELLIKHGPVDEAIQVAQGAVWVDIESAEVHLLHAQALRAAGQRPFALAELDSALACAPQAAVALQVHALYADIASELGQQGKAREHRSQAAKLREAASGRSLPE
jgi:tetratricopeptide (TPR) repeat protein